MANILIAIPSNTGRSTYPVPFVHSLITALIYAADENTDLKFELKYFTGLRIDQERNAMVKYARTKEFDAMIMIDDDMSFPFNAIDKLLKLWKKGHYVVSAIYHAKGWPFHAFCSNGKEWSHAYPKDQVIPSLMIGTGLILMDTSIWAYLNIPYFLLSVDCDGNILGTEDCYFAENCKLNGIEIVVDTSNLAQHISTVTFPDFFSDPYVNFRGKIPFNFDLSVGNVEEIPRKEVENHSKLKGIPVLGSKWHDGINVCGHVNQIKLPYNEGEIQRYKCQDCGLISGGIRYEHEGVIYER